MVSQANAGGPSGGQTITVKSEDGQTATFRPAAALAIMTAADAKSTTVVLQGGFTILVKGSGEGLRKKIFGTSPEDVKAAVKQQLSRPGAPKRATA